MTTFVLLLLIFLVLLGLNRLLKAQETSFNFLSQQTNPFGQRIYSEGN